MSDKINQKEFIDHIMELIDGLHIETDGRIDLLADILDERMNEPRKVLYQFIEAGIESPLADKMLTENEEVVRSLRFLHKNKLIKDRVELNNIKPDAEIGRKRRAQQGGFGKISNKERSDERKKEWTVWKYEAQRLIKLNPALKSNKSELARKVILNLSLSDKEETVRKRL